jgi:hypothetical protein
MDYLSTDLQSAKIATAIEKGSFSRKEHRPSANSLETLSEDSFCKVLDNVSTSSRSIPGRKLFLNFEKNGGRRVKKMEEVFRGLVVGVSHGFLNFQSDAIT